MARNDVYGLKPLNAEQGEALAHLLNEDIKLVTLIGKAGTGKTLLAIAAALQQVVTYKMYKKVIVSRPLVPMGADIGFLPGTTEEKLHPWTAPIFDNIEYLMSLSKRASRTGANPQEFIQNGFLQVEALTYIRGRSIPQQFIIIDEAQNLTPHEVKTILTRAGEGTKIVLTGDPDQIDREELTKETNGLTYVAERFKDQTHISKHIVLTQCERSELAELAADLL